MGKVNYMKQLVGLGYDIGISAFKEGLSQNGR